MPLGLGVAQAKVICTPSQMPNPNNPEIFCMQLCQFSALMYLLQGLGLGLAQETLSNGAGFWAYEYGQSIFRRLHGRSPTPKAPPPFFKIFVF